jgi:predicted nucleic acid-binding protein
MKRKLNRVVFDTNLWRSILIKNDLKCIDYNIRNGEIKFIFVLNYLKNF